jgi:hypothetical protein
VAVIVAVVVIVAIKAVIMGTKAIIAVALVELRTAIN